MLIRRGLADHPAGMLGANPAWHDPNHAAAPFRKHWYALLWLLGIPIPVLLGLFLLRGCN